MNRFEKWVNLALVLAALVLGLLLQQMFSQMWEIFRFPLFENWPVNFPTILAIGIAILVFLAIRASIKAMTFLREVAIELSKVTWPDTQQTVTSTGVVIVMLAIAAVILFGFDTLWGTLTRSFLAL